MNPRTSPSILRTRVCAALPGRSLACALGIACALALGACSSSDDDADPPPDDGTTTDTGGGADGSGTGDGGGEGETGDGTTDDGDGPGGPDVDDAGIATLDIDATAGGFGAEPDDPANRWAYLDLDRGAVLDLDDEAATASSDWEIAFKRVAVRLNGGVSGPGEARGAIVDAQLDFYDEDGEPDVDAFVAATAESEYAAIAAAVDPATLAYVEESEAGAIVGDGQDVASSWWIYDPAAFSVTANPSVRYAVRGADGTSYAKIRVTDIQQAERQISIELMLQGSDAAAFDGAATTWTALIGAAGGALCYDFDAMGEVDCEAAAASWDLQAEVSADGRVWNLWTNGGVRGAGGSGASFGPLDAATAATFGTGDDVPVWSADTTGGVFDEYEWYGYSLRGENRIWPNFRVYAIDGGERAWKLQILRYYDESGASGNLRVRFADLAPTEKGR